MTNENLSKNILKKVKRKIAISNFEKEDTKMVKNKTGKMVATFLLTTGLTASVVFAGTMVYEKVFKEPKKYQSYEELIQEIRKSQGSQEVTKKDEEKAVNIEEANKFLNKFGYENQEFVTKELKKNYIMGAELVYYFTTDTNLNKGIHVGINAENGKCICFENKNLAHSGFQPDQISKDEAIKRADKIYNLFDLKENEYKINEILELPCYFPDNEGNSAE